MKVCDLTQFYSPVSGGVKRYVHEKTAYVVRERPGDEHVLVVPGEKTGCVTEGRSRVYTIHSPLLSRSSRYRALLNLRAVGDILEKERPDIIESSDPYQVAWKAASVGKALGIPVLGYYHSHFPEIYERAVERRLGRLAGKGSIKLLRSYVRDLYNRFECTLVPSEALAQVLTDWGVHDVRTMPLGVDTSVFRPDVDDRFETRNSLGIRNDRELLLYVGRLSADKNVRMLFRAFDLLERREPGRFHLLVVGDGQDRESMLHLQRGGGSVTWIRYVPDSADLARFYRASDLFVHPGLHETFGLVALESQASGTPVVGIRGSRMDSIIQGGVDCWAAGHSEEDLAAAVSQYAASGLLMSREALSGLVAAYYSWNGVFARLFCIYEEILAKYRRN